MWTGAGFHGLLFVQRKRNRSQPLAATTGTLDRHTIHDAPSGGKNHDRTPHNPWLSLSSGRQEIEYSDFIVKAKEKLE
jgi:hypothetical protein